MSAPLVDPNLAALRDSDPARLLEDEPRPSPAGGEEHRIEPVAVELAVAFVAVCGLIARFLAEQDPRAGEVTVVAGQAWRNHAPLWLRMAVPAIRHAYALGRVEGLGEDELEAMATDYAVNLGDYLHESSGQALADGFTRQLDARWSEGLAWRRAAAAYGLDRQQMRSYISGALRRSEETGKADPAAAAGRLLVEKLLVQRAERMGATESWRAMQSGRAIAWLLQAQTGQLPPGTLKQWDTRPGACPVCQALHEQLVPVTEPFMHPVSKVRLWAPGAHPECRCGMHLAREPLAKAAVSAAGICLVAADTGRVLMLQRALDPADPAGGLWELPGGGLKPGEQPRRGAEREFAEEVHRRLPGDVRHIGHWVQGAYQGFVLITATEDAVEPHRRGRIVNPDDPDGIEALAWWDPEQWARNPALRPELRGALPAVRALLAQSRIAKARAGDPYDRDRRGRFARVEARPAREAKTRPADPAVRQVLRDLERVKEQPFTGPALFQDRLFQDRPFQAGQLFRAPGQDLFAKPGSAKPGSPFDRTRRPTPRRRVIRHLLLETPAGPDSEHLPYYLPQEEYSNVFEFEPQSMILAPGDLIDFAEANQILREGHLDKYSDRTGLAAVRWAGRPTDLLELDQPWASTGEAMGRWAEILPLARAASQAAIADADELVDRLSQRDLRTIYVMAGRHPEGETDASLRAAISRAARGRDGGDESLLGAYVDHMVWDESEMLGENGMTLASLVNDAVDGDLVFHGADKLQFLTFINGFHAPTAPERHSVDVDSDYVVDEVVYHSGLIEQGSGIKPYELGWREVRLVPVDGQGRRLPVD